ncbi:MULTISPECIES: hypothetical protein [Marinobacter]|uniref:hypothetical protein n=1 Tax=Marinobacter TaxID=2742 RepID=UPI001CD92255|nr:MULTISPECIES: hypothetical protein [Marinobacter]
MVAPYITGQTALCTLQPGRLKPFWHDMGSPAVWAIAGQNFPDTSYLFGEREIVEISEFLALSGMPVNLFRCASYERAVFDLLYHYIEQNNRMVPNNRVVPNIQPTDIDDVVDFELITAWVWDWERSGHLEHGAAMRSWLKADDPWVKIQS